MSRIGFNSPNNCHFIPGRERYRLQNYIQNVMWAFVPKIKSAELAKLALNEPPKCTDAESIRSWVFYSSDGDIQVFNKKTNWFRIQLNTMLRIGGDCLKLMTRIHGQCECHGYVEGKNRKWLADIIEKGLSKEFIEYEGLVSFLRDNNVEPVVMDYSVTNSFPTRVSLSSNSKMDRIEFENFENLDKKDQWEIAMKDLRNLSEGLEITPDNWDSFVFGEGFDIFDVLNYVQQIRENNKAVK